VTRRASARFRRTEAGKKQHIEDSARRCRLQGWRMHRGVKRSENAANRERCEARVVKFETAVVDARGCCGYLLRSPHPHPEKYIPRSKSAFRRFRLRVVLLAELGARRDAFYNRFPCPRCGILFESIDNLVAHER
jgi:hypothetical protein